MDINIGVYEKPKDKTEYSENSAANIQGLTDVITRQNEVWQFLKKFDYLLIKVTFTGKGGHGWLVCKTAGDEMGGAEKSLFGSVSIPPYVYAVCFKN